MRREGGSIQAPPHDVASRTIAATILAMSANALAPVFARTVAVAIVSLAAIGLTSCGRNDVRQTHSLPTIDLGGPPAGAHYDLTLLFTNDIHAQVVPFGNPSKGGLARHARLMSWIRDEAAARNTGILALNAGDNFEGSLFYDADGGAFVFRLLDRLGYDVCQVGNHDHQFGSQRLYDVLATAFPGFDQHMRITFGNVNPSTLDTTGTLPQVPVAPEVVGAFENGFADVTPGNLDRTRMDAPFANGFVFNQSLFFERNGIRIGVFGVDTDEVLYTGVPGPGTLFPDPSQTSEFLTFYDALAAPYASQMIAYLDDPDGDPQTDDGADVIVCVSHLGTDVELQLAAQAVAPNGRTIDVVVGGHSHTRLNTAVPVTHSNGKTTFVVQSGSRGEYLGRIDLAVDPPTNGVTLVNCKLIEVDDRIPEDQALSDAIAAEAARPGGLNAQFADPLHATLCDCDVHLPGDISAPNALGNLAADAALAAAQPQGADMALIGSFVFRADVAAGPVTRAAAAEVFPLHTLDRSGLNRDSLHLVDFAGGFVVAPNLAALFDPNQTPATFTNITRIEYFLEIVYSLQGFLNVLAPVFGPNIGTIEPFISGLQWSGIEFVVDQEAPLFQRIDTASIRIAGVPLVGHETLPHRIAMNSVLAEIAMPFIGFAATVESPPGSGLSEPLLDYDPNSAETGISLANALSTRLSALGRITAANSAIGGDRVRPRGPDLFFDPGAAVLTPPSVPAGYAVSVTLPVRNAGDTGVAGATLELLLDLTPNSGTDDPDGYTDGITGVSENVVASVPVGSVAPFAGGMAGTTLVTARIVIPSLIPPGSYRIRPRIRDVVSSDAAHPERVTANNFSNSLFVTLWVSP